MRTPKSLLYVVFRPELSSWGLDLSFSGLIWQGFFPALIVEIQKIFIYGFPRLALQLPSPVVCWVKSPALNEHSLALSALIRKYGHVLFNSYAANCSICKSS